jgi:hypothetical protein
MPAYEQIDQVSFLFKYKGVIGRREKRGQREKGEEGILGRTLSIFCWYVSVLMTTF